MTNQQHPITPPEDLLQQLRRNTYTRIDQIIIAYQAGADQELEACGRWLEDQLCMSPDAKADVITQLNGSRRPKPPSLKEQALALLDKAEDPSWDINDFSIIQRLFDHSPRTGGITQ